MDSKKAKRKAPQTMTKSRFIQIDERNKENLPPLQNERGESNDEDDDDDDDDDDDGEPIVPADRDAQVPRTEVLSLLDGKVLHEWRDHLQVYHAGGVIKNGEEKNIDVVGDQKIPRDGDTAECAIVVLGEYGCSKKRGVYEGNPTTRAIQREVRLCLGDEVKLFVVWVDMCKISARETNAGINERKIGPILGENVSLQNEFFERFQASLRSLISIEAHKRVNRYPVIVIAGNQVEENAFKNWHFRGYLHIVHTICVADPFRVLLVAVKMINDDGSEYEQSVVFIAGGDHPSAHLRRKNEDVEKFKILCSLMSAAIGYARIDCNKTFDEFLGASVKQRLEVMKKRKEKFLELFRESGYERLSGVDVVDVVVDDELSRYTKHFAHLRLVELENREVAENVKWFLNAFAENSRSVLKYLKLKTFVKMLGRLESSTLFRKSLTTLKGNLELLKKIENALSSNSFYAALAEKGDAYLDALAKARTSGAFKGIDAAYANFMGSNSFHAAFKEKGDAYLDALAKARTSGAFKDIDAAYAKAMGSGSFHAAFKEKGDAYLDALAKVRTSPTYKENDAAYANFMGSNSFHAAFKEKGDAYLDALAKARTSGAFKDIDAAYAKAMGSNSFHAAFKEKGDAYLDALAKARTSGAFKGIDAAYANAIGVDSFHSAFSKKGDAYLDALAKARTSGAFKGIDAAYAKAIGVDSFHSAFSKKGDAYLDALAKARTSGAFKGIDAAYAKAMGSNSFLSAYAKKGDAFLKELEGVKAAQIFARNPDAIERAQKKGSYNAAVNKLGGDKLRERLDKLVLPSNAFGGNEELLNKGMGVNGFHSAIANADENAVRSFLAELNSAKEKLTMNGDASLFEVAMTNDTFHACISNKNGCDDFINLLGRMITSQAFVDNPQARKNAIRGRPVLRALFKRGQCFLTALVEVQQKSYRNKKAFAVQLGRVDKKYGTTCREFVDEILLRLSTAGQVLQHQQQPPQPPQQQKHQREEKQQQQERREVQNRFASGAKRKRAEDGEASARIDEAQQLPLAQTVPQQQQQQQQQLVRGNRVKIYGDIPSANENFTGLTPKQINTRRNKLKGEIGEIIEIVNNPGKKHTQYIVKLNNTIRVSGKPLPKTFSVLASNLISLA
ncbi:unnamed protein product [Bathycoccus prasinos]